MKILRLKQILIFPGKRIFSLNKKNSFIFGYKDNSILAFNRENVFLFDYEAGKLVKKFEEIGEDIAKIALDPHYNRVIFSIKLFISTLLQMSLMLSF